MSARATWKGALPHPCCSRSQAGDTGHVTDAWQLGGSPARLRVDLEKSIKLQKQGGRTGGGGALQDSVARGQEGSARIPGRARSSWEDEAGVDGEQGQAQVF